MHLNVRFRLPYLEWLLVTPRYHHIHHSSNPEHFTKNLSLGAELGFGFISKVKGGVQNNKQASNKISNIYADNTDFCSIIICNYNELWK